MCISLYLSWNSYVTLEITSKILKDFKIIELKVTKQGWEYVQLSNRMHVAWHVWGPGVNSQHQGVIRERREGKGREGKNKIDSPKISRLGLSNPVQ